MATLRSVNTEFWADEYIGEQSRDAKFLFLYFLTNSLTNIAGAYKISRKRIKQDTDFADAELDRLLDQFERDGKVIYRDGWLFLPNFLKNQSLGGNLPKTAINLLLETPDWIQSAVSKAITESPKLEAVFVSHRDLVLCLRTKSGCIDTRSANRKEENRKEGKEEEKSKILPPGSEKFGEPKGGQTPPAIMAVQILTGQLPERSVWPTLIDILGDKPDTKRLSECYKAWAMVSTNKFNYSAWIADWYVNGIPDKHSRNGPPGLKAVPKVTMSDDELAIRFAEQKPTRPAKKIQLPQ